VDLYRWLDEDYRIETYSEGASVPEDISDGTQEGGGSNG